MRKKLSAMVLALVLALSLIPGASAAELAKASTQSVEVDGTPVEFQMYALESAGGLTNYVKLRDVAHVLNSTPAKFSVGYDGTISIVTGEAYTDNGSEMTTPYSGDRAYQPGPGSVRVNGADVSLDAIVLTDDNGGAYTYFKLRDLGNALGFKVDWTGERGVFIETGAEAAPAAPAASDLTLADFSGVWRREVELISGNTGVREYIFAGDQYEAVTYDKSGVSNERGYGPYWYESGTVTLGKNIYSTNADTTFPYVLDLHARERYTGAAYVNASDTFSFSLREANLAAGYLLDRNGERYDKVESSLYRDAAKAKMEAHKEAEAAAQAAAQASGEDYAFRALDYIYHHLKFPSTMSGITVRCGPYDRSGLSNAVMSSSDAYYVVVVGCRAANSFGNLVHDEYVCLFNLTTGETTYDAVGTYESIKDHAVGARKIELLTFINEMLFLSGDGGERPGWSLLPDETVEQIMAKIRE